MTGELMSKTEYWAVDIEDENSPYVGRSYTVTISEDENTGSSEIEVYDPERDGIVSGQEEMAVLQYFDAHKEEK
jgi:hypothetical protein